MPTVLLLGASSDMSVAIARKFASAGYAIQLAARDVARLQPLQSDLAIRSNTACTLHEFDATRPETHAAFFHALPVRPDVTICVFGYLGDQQLAEKDWNECAAIIGVNYTGAVSILNVAAAEYAAAKSGVIVGISSVAGERGRQSNYFYGSAKAGFTAYLSGLRNRLFREGVHVVTVKPGFVYTKMTEGLKLPGLLTANPAQVAAVVYKAVIRKKDVVYVKWFWRWIMLIIRNVPEILFKKMKL